MTRQAVISELPVVPNENVNKNSAMEFSDSRTGEWLGRFRRLPKPGHILAWYGLIRQLRRERNRLLTLSDEQLKDIGVTRHDAYREAGRAFIDIPGNRLRR